MTSSLEKFCQTIAQLRDPDHGCPWDLKQSHASLKKYFLEEVYEFLHEVDENDFEGMEEELGDVLLQIFLHAQLLKEETAGQIDIESVAQKIDAKIVHRHPHVFDPQYQPEGKSVEEIWAETKNAQSDGEKIQDPFEEAMGLPPLQRVEKIYRKIKGDGFKFPNREMALDKVREELDEVSERMKERDEEGLKEEFGDLVLAVFSASLEFGYSPEELLQSSMGKFHKRWRKFSTSLIQDQEDLSSMAYQDILRRWTRSKNE